MRELLGRWLAWWRSLRSVNRTSREVQAMEHYAQRSMGYAAYEVTASVSLGRGWRPAGLVGRALSRLPAQLRMSPEEHRAITSVPWTAQTGGPLSSTPSVDQALTLAPVYGAASILAKSVASMPLHAYRNVGDQRLKIPTLPQLFQKPSIHGTIWDWLHRLIASLALTGNAYGLITARDGYQYPTQIEWLNPADVSVEDMATTGPGSYQDPIFRWLGVPLAKEQLVHIPWFTVPYRIKGLSPIGAFATSLRTGLSAQTYADDWFKGGAVPPGTFQNSEKIVPPEEANEIKGRLMSAMRTHQPLVYGRDWKYEPIAIPPGEARFVETAKLTATQIAVIYDIPPERIGGETGRSMTYANVEQQQIQMIQSALLPYLVKLETAFFELLPERQYVKFNVDSLIRTSTMERHQVWQLDRQMGLRNINEIRELEDLPPIGKKGDDYSPLKVIESQGAPAVGAAVIKPTQPAPGRPAGGAPQPGGPEPSRPAQGAPPPAGPKPPAAGQGNGRTPAKTSQS